MNLYKQCKDYADYAKVLEFEAYIAGIKFDEVNKRRGRGSRQSGITRFPLA